MPYATNADLPPAVRKLPADKQTQWREVFNAALEQYGDEATAFKVAWAAVKKSEAHTMSKAYSIVFGDAEMKVWKAASDSGDNIDDLWFGGVLASTSIDRENEAFTEDCLKALAETITAEPLDVVGGTHSPGVDSVLGILRKGEFRRVGNVGELYVEGFLFGDDPAAKRAYRQMAAGRVAMSIGGKIGKAYRSGTVRYLAAVKPDHALACRKGTAVNGDTWTAPLAKAIADADAAEAEESRNHRHFAIAQMQAEVEQAEADLDKAGARHSRKDIEALHGAMQALQRTCGCETCAAAIEAIEAAASEEAAKADTEEEATNMAEETKQEDAVEEELVEQAEAETPDQEPVAKAEAETEAPPQTADVDVDAIIAKAVAAGRKAAQEDTKAEMDDLREKLAKATEELEKLKKAPVPGGPEGKPSGEDEKTQEVAKSEASALVQEYLKAGDKESAGKVLAARIAWGVEG